MNVDERLVLLCAVSFAVSAVLIAKPSAHVRARFDLRVMPWVEPGWRLSARWEGADKRGRARIAMTSDEFTAAASGALVSIGLASIAAPGRPVLAVPSAAVGACLALWLRQSTRARSRRAHARAITDQVPHIADLLSLHIGAGMSISQALTAVHALVQGPLATVLGEVIVRIDGGDTASAALRSSAGDGRSTAWRLLAQALAACIERGTPVAAAIRAQARDLRHSRMQEALAASGKQEVAMLVPIVFLVLPAIVVVALFPGWQSLHSLL